MEYVTFNSIIFAIIMPFQSIGDIEVDQSYFEITTGYCVESTIINDVTNLKFSGPNYCTTYKTKFPDRSKKQTIDLSGINKVDPLPPAKKEFKSVVFLKKPLTY